MGSSPTETPNTRDVGQIRFYEHIVTQNGTLLFALTMSKVG